ncbi:PEGA domain-containing protein [Methanoregula sp.]|uniref:PEGA domain-containing protein n=1 Tax=Methanoregula sp. TaxID=2052170 RepID=UPI003C7765F8
MKHTLTILLAVLLVCALCAVIVAPVVADGESPIGVLTTPTPEPVTFVTPEPTTVMTTVPTTEPTTIVTTIPPTTAETTETITIPPSQVGGDKGWIDTYCNVDGAQVYFDGAPECTIAGGVCSVAVVVTGSPISTVTVSKSGYTTWSGALSSMPAPQAHVAVYTTINPIVTPTTYPPVQSGTIYAQSSPVGAAIYMNGNFYGYSPVTIPNLVPGSYSMKASLNGYTPDTQIVYVYAGQTATYYPALQQSPPAPHSTGTVTVTSNPDHVLVYVDGSYQGKGPLTVTLFPGSHTFRLTLTGYNDYTANVYVNAYTNQNLNAIMAPAVYGTIAVTSMPGASVYMDSTYQGTIPSSGTLTLYNVANGNRLIKVSAGGYNDWINSVYVQPNAITPINAVLTAVGPNPTPVPATGGFNIVSTPAGAEIYVDNLFQGYTPSMPNNIAPGQHQILLKYTGYVDYLATASVTSGQTMPLAISMQPAPSPTPASAPSPVTFIGCLAVAAGVCVAHRRRS